MKTMNRAIACAALLNLAASVVVGSEPVYPVKVSENHRYFADQKGQPGLAAKAPEKSPPVPAGWFVYAMRYNDVTAGTATDVSFLNDKPAGRKGRIIVRDGHFVQEKTGKPIRFLGIGVGAFEAFPNKADAEMFARRLAKGGSTSSACTTWTTISPAARAKGSRSGTSRGRITSVIRRSSTSWTTLSISSSGTAST